MFVRRNRERSRAIASLAQTKGKITEIELQLLQTDQDLKTEVGKDLCLIPGAEVAILNILGTDNARLGQVTLPLDSFIGFHEDDPARRAMAAAMWRTNAPMLLEQAIRKQ